MSTPRHLSSNSISRRSLSGMSALGLAGGACLVGIGFTSGGSAEAATTLVYNCNTSIGAKDVSVTIDTDAPATGTVGSAVSVKTVSGKIELDGSLGNAMAGFLGWKSVSGTSPAQSVIAGGGTSQTIDTTLVTPNTPIYDSTWVNDGTYGGFGPDGNIVLPLGATINQTMTPTAAGDYTISAPESFTSTFTGTKADGTTASMDVPCTYKSGTKVIDTIVVSAAPATSTTEPSTTEPSTTGPSTTEPSTTQPSTTEPSTTQPSTTEPSTTQPSTTEPSTTQPSTTEPSTSEPTATGTETPATPSTVQTGDLAPGQGANLWTLAGVGLAGLGLAGLAGATLTGRRED